MTFVTASRLALEDEELTSTVTLSELDAATLRFENAMASYREYIFSYRATPQQVTQPLNREQNIRREIIREQLKINRQQRVLLKQKEKGQLIRYKVLSKQKLDTICVNECIICQDKHLMKDIIITDCCNNHYCKPCLTKWLQTSNQTGALNHNCPTCRAEYPTTLGFRQRETKSKNRIEHI